MEETRTLKKLGLVMINNKHLFKTGLSKFSTDLWSKGIITDDELILITDTIKDFMKDKNPDIFMCVPCKWEPIEAFIKTYMMSQKDDSLWDKLRLNISFFISNLMK